MSSILNRFVCWLFGHDIVERRSRSLIMTHNIVNGRTGEHLKKMDDTTGVLSSYRCKRCGHKKGLLQTIGGYTETLGYLTVEAYIDEYPPKGEK